MNPLAISLDFVENQVGSYHQAYVRALLINDLLKLEAYTVFCRLTLAIDQSELTPDICLYEKQAINLSAMDVLKMYEMPLLVVEILSPKQGIQEVLERFEHYFKAGVQSCWLVIPVAHAVVVYSAMNQAQVFCQTAVVDTVLDIRLPLAL